MKKQIILLNGPSSSGKSTLSRALHGLISERKKEKYAIISIDDFMKLSTEETIYEDEVFEIYTSPDDFDIVKENLEKNGITIADSSLDLIPSNYVNMDTDKQTTFLKMIDALEENDDVQSIYHNVTLPEEEDEE